MDIDSDREKVKRSIKHVLEQWVCHHRIARHSGEPVPCLNCHRTGLMDIVFIEDGDPTKVTYQCRRCRAQIEHECMLGRGRVFATRRDFEQDSMQPLFRPYLSPIWNSLNRQDYLEPGGYCPLDEAIGMGCLALNNAGVLELDRHEARVALLLTRLTQMPTSPLLWVARDFLCKLRATSLTSPHELVRSGQKWHSNLILLPENAVFSPNDGPCPFLGIVWQRAGEVELFNGEKMLNLVDKLIVWTCCPKSGAMFSMELNLGGNLNDIHMDVQQSLACDEDNAFCLSLLKMALKISLLIDQHPGLISSGKQVGNGNYYEPNWLGRNYTQERQKPTLGAGTFLQDSKDRAIA